MSGGRALAATVLVAGVAVLLIRAVTQDSSGSSPNAARSGPHATAADWALARQRGVGSAIPHGLARSRGATRYVSTRGSDRNPGTRKRPWRTVQRAVNRLRPGQRALVSRGTYREDLLVTRRGRRDAPITIAATPGQRVVLEPRSTAGNTYAIEIAQDAAFIRVRGFVIQGARGISSTNIYFENRVHDIEVSHNEVLHSQDQGMFAERTTSNLFILANRIHDNGWHHVVGQHQSHGLYIEGRNHVIANNLIANHPYGFGATIYPSNSGTLLVSNTIVRSGHSSVVVGGADGVEGIVVRNNILAFNGNYGVEMDDERCPTRTVVDTNIIRASAAGAIEGGCSGVDTSRGNIKADPQFVSPARGRYLLQRDSPAIDRADDAYSPRTDIRGYVRVAGEHADIGAYEYVR